MIRWLFAISVLVGLAGCQQFALPDSVKEQNSILAAFGSAVPTPAEAAQLALDPYNAANRSRGTNLLLNAPFGGEPEYIEIYEMRIQDEDERVRAIAARALGRHGDPSHVPEILPLLASDDPAVTLDAVQALQRLHNPSAVGPLVAQLKSENQPESEIRAEAADALGQYPEGRVFDSLVQALDDDYLAVSSRALRSLQTLTGQPFPNDPPTWVQWRTESADPFSDQQRYLYPIFERDRRWLDYVPFTFPAQNEVAASPVGMPEAGRAP